MSEGRNTELVSSWREAMEGVTPGPWNPSRFGMQVLTGDSWSTVCTFHNNNGTDGKWNDHRLAAWEDGRGAALETSNADWVARCSPSGISALLDALESTSRALSEKEGELAEVRAEIERVTSDRPYVVGWNDGFEHVHGPLRFPTMLRKMWSGGEVQAWLDQQRIEAARQAAADEGSELSEVTRQRDEALAALKASEERGAATDARVKALEEVLTKAKAFHDRDSGCNGFTADYECLRWEINDLLGGIDGQ